MTVVEPRVMPVGYDTEFYDDRFATYLISSALVRPDGITGYWINRDMPIRAIQKDEFLMDEVWPKLPLKRNGKLDYDHPDVMPLDQIAEGMKEFLKLIPKWRLVADCVSFDGVKLVHMYRKGEEPKGWDWWIYEIQQERDRLGGIDLPEKDPEKVHHAVYDARWALEAYFHLQEQAAKLMVGR